MEPIFQLLNAGYGKNRQPDMIKRQLMASGQNGSQEPKLRDSKPGAGKQIPPNLMFWWMIFAALMVWNMFSLWPREHKVAEIPYSTFLSQIRAGNVAQVHIAGESISGKFVKPILWPPAKRGR